MILGSTVAELFDSLSGRTRFAHFCAAFNNIWQPTGSSRRRHLRPVCGAGPVVLGKRVKFHDPSLEVDDDVISGMAVDNADMDVRIKFDDFRSNGSRDIRGVYFVSNERTSMAKPIPIARFG